MAEQRQNNVALTDEEKEQRAKKRNRTVITVVSVAAAVLIVVIVLLLLLVKCEPEENVDPPVGHTHTYSSWVVVDEPTCTEEGLRERTCSCGEKETEQIAALDIRIGDWVYVEKGGEIIPKITGVELSKRPAGSRPFEYISECPVCGTPLVRYEGEAKHYCPNQNRCEPQILGRIVHFIRRKAMDIDGLGEETVELLYRNGLIRNAADLYDLRPDQLACLPRLGEKSADNIIESIRRSKEVPFARLLFALGIRFVGETTAKYLASHFGSMDAVMGASREELVEAEEVGPKVADGIVEYFADEANRTMVERLRQAGLKFAAETAVLRSDALAGKSFVISGKFSGHSRDELKELIEQHGGRNLATVSGNVDYIVAGENMGPAKLRKAEKLGIPLLSEEEFIAMLKDDETEAAAAGREEGSSFQTESGDSATPAPSKTKKEKEDPTQGSLFQV